jgi:hypothetical protein
MPSDPTEEEQRWEVLADTLVPMVERWKNPPFSFHAVVPQRSVVPCVNVMSVRQDSRCRGLSFEESEMEEERPPCELEQHLFNM